MSHLESRVSAFAVAASLALTALSALVPGGAGAQPTPAPAPAFHARRLEGRPSPPATLASTAWLAGRWVGEGLGGDNEEIWSEPKGGVMMGMYRLLKGGKPAFYELLWIVEEKGTLVLRLRHFNPDLTAWEEKDKTVDFPLVAVEERAVHFSGLSFLRDEDGSLRIYLLLRGKDGVLREEAFHLRRAG